MKKQIISKEFKKMQKLAGLNERKFYSRDYVKQKYGDKAKEIEANIEDEEDNNPNIFDLYTSLETAEETDDFVKGFINENQLNENENYDPNRMLKLIEMYVDNHFDEGMSAKAALEKIDELLQGNLDGYDKAFMAGEEDQY